MTTEIYRRISREQLALCEEFGAEYRPTDPASKLGISEGAMKGNLPIHGLRHSSSGELSGWFIWSGDYSAHADFFRPLHVEHAILESMAFVRFLGLAPGWRFLLGDNGHVDVWFDPDLLDAA